MTSSSFTSFDDFEGNGRSIPKLGGADIGELISATRRSSAMLCVRAWNGAGMIFCNCNPSSLPREGIPSASGSPSERSPESSSSRLCPIVLSLSRGLLRLRLDDI